MLPRFAAGKDPTAKWVSFKLSRCGPKEDPLPTEGCSVTIGMGAALAAAAMESESRLDAASDC